MMQDVTELEEIYIVGDAADGVIIGAMVNLWPTALNSHFP
jgi:hypothetical protein